MSNARKPPLCRLELEGLIIDARSSVLLLDLALDAIWQSAREKNREGDGINLAVTKDQDEALYAARSLAFRAVRQLSASFYAAGEIS